MTPIEIAELAYRLPRADCTFDYRRGEVRARLVHGLELTRIRGFTTPFLLAIQEGAEILHAEAFSDKTTAIEAAAYEIQKRGIGSMVTSPMDGETYFLFDDNEIGPDTPDDLLDERVGSW